jgi:PD-(D/E)XK nuclease superfamily
VRGVLPVGRAERPWFGPRVFDDAVRCPAKAASALRSWSLPWAQRPEPVGKLSEGAWLAAATLIRELAKRMRTSVYVANRDRILDLERLAVSVLPQQSIPVREFAVEAVESLLEAQASSTSCVFDFYPEFVKMPFGSGEMHAGGAFAFSGPEGAWQLWRMRMTRALPASEASGGWALVAARSLAGHLDAEGRAPLRSVEVFEAGAVSGPSVLLGTWGRQALLAEFEAVRAGKLREMALDLRIRPGSHCADCKFVGACPAAARIDGLLQFVPRQPTVRKVTATDLRAHAACARRYQLLMVEGLPGEPANGEALLRGQHLDAWLSHNHARGVRCSDADVERFRAENGDDRGASMASHHLGVCPLADPQCSAITVQTDVVALDSRSRTLLVGRPDAVYLRDTKAVWRETKTRTVLAAIDAQQLVETDVTAALYLVLLASGATGTPDALEWEELGVDRHEVTVLAADDEDLVEAARTRVSAAVADLLSDSVYPPRVGIGCAQCAVRGRCADAP